MRNFLSLLCTLCLVGGFITPELNAQSSRQQWTETFATAAQAFEAASRQLPSEYEVRLLSRETIRENRSIERYELLLNDYAVYGKQLLVTGTANGRFRAAYPIALPRPGSLKMNIEQASWRTKLSNLLSKDAYVYTEHHYAIVPVEFDFDRSDFVLAAIIETAVPNSHRHDRIYLDAATGKLIARHAIDCTFVPGTAETLNHGTQTIETTQDGPNGSFRLFDTSRGEGIRTVGVDENDLFDADNDWSYNDVTLSMALDVHYGMGVTHDFLKNQFGRIGLDGQGVALRSVTGEQFANAFYGGPENMGFGAGEPGANLNLPLSAIDIVGHEMAHGVTAFMNGLIYNGESGGLNEAFSDIIGVTVEHNSHPVEGVNAWRLGEQASTTGYFIRNMSDPSEKEMPDTYGGVFWSDNLEVHSGSSIANYWYYLLVAGDSGTNDVGYEFNVPAIGYDKAVDIVYDAFSNLMPSSNYADCSIATILAATERFGACSAEVNAVEEAWRAVNVLTGVAGVGSSDLFRSCEANETITFTAEAPGAFLDWNFGDGTQSTDNPATHVYTEDGSYLAYFRFLNCAGDTVVTNARNSVAILTEVPDACLLTELNRNLIEIDGCFGQLTDDGGIEGDYNDDLFNEARLSNPDAAAYRFMFEAFALETGFDYLLFYQGNDSEPLYSFTGYTLPATFEVGGNDVRVVFSTDGSVTDAGFLLAFECIQAVQAPSASIVVPGGLACRALRTYSAVVVDYPTSYAWSIDDTEYGQSDEFTFNWQTLGPGEYELSLEVCNALGCNTTTETIVITDEIGTCEETVLNNGTTQLSGCFEGSLVDDGGVDGEYSNQISSTVLMSNEEGNHYRLNFIEYFTEDNYDYLYVTDNTDPSNPQLLATYNGFLQPFEVVFPTSNLLIRFETDGSVTESGFIIDYACVETTATTNLLTNIDWKVAPNPFGQQFYVHDLPAQTDWTLQLFSADGRLVATQLAVPGNEQVAFDTGAIPSGLYWLRAVSDEGTLEARRVVKQ